MGLRTRKKQKPENGVLKKPFEKNPFFFHFALV